MSDQPSSGEQSRNVTVYWRPGCGFCSGLFRMLDHHSVAYDAVDIWRDPDAAAIVRSVARGHETVPTVVVGNIAMVNPTVGEVIAALAAA